MAALLAWPVEVCFEKVEADEALVVWRELQLDGILIEPLAAKRSAIEVHDKQASLMVHERRRAPHRQ